MEVAARGPGLALRPFGFASDAIQHGLHAIGADWDDFTAPGPFGISDIGGNVGIDSSSAPNGADLSSVEVFFGLCRSSESRAHLCAQCQRRTLACDALASLRLRIGTQRR